MHIVRVGPDDTLVSALEEHVQMKNVRMIWVINQDDADTQYIRSALEDEDYTVASGPRPTNVHFNTLVTPWNVYAADQDEFAELLPKLDIIVLDGMTELNQLAWIKWAENIGNAGWPLSNDVSLILT